MKRPGGGFAYDVAPGRGFVAAKGDSPVLGALGAFWGDVELFFGASRGGDRFPGANAGPLPLPISRETARISSCKGHLPLPST